MRRSTRARKLHSFPLINLICTYRTDGTAAKRDTSRFSMEVEDRWKRHDTYRKICDIYHSRVSILIVCS